VGYYGVDLSDELYGYLVCFDSQGGSVFEDSIGLNYASPVIGDVDGDGEVEVLISCGERHLFHAFKANGEKAAGWPIQIGGGSWSSPCLTDLEGDGDMEILLGCTDEKLYSWDLPNGYYTGDMEWPCYQHDQWHTGCYPGERILSGHLSHNETWEGQVRVGGDLTVEEGVTLTINPGTTVKFTAGVDNQAGGVDTNLCELIVEGNLHAYIIGSPKTFSSTSSNPGSWYGIRVKGEGWVFMDNATVKDAYCGVSFDSANGGCITSCTIKDNLVYGIRGCAADDLDICSNTIFGNNSYGVYTEDCSPYIMGNNFPNPPQGCAIKAVGDSPERVIVISGNIISMPVIECDDLREGDTTATKGIVVEYASAQIMNNVIGGGYYGIIGVGLDSTTIIKGTSYLDQTLERNVVGLALYSGSKPTVSGNNISEYRTIGVACYESYPLLGDSLISGTGHNSITPGPCSPHYAVYCEGVTDTIKAEVNWWGESPPDPSWFYGPVDYDPWLTSIGVEEHPEASLPDHFTLSQNYPNPFNPTTIIHYQLPAVSDQPSGVSLKVYNILGQEVRTLVDKKQLPGYYSVEWDGEDSSGRDLASGVYIYRIQAGEFVQSRRMILLK